MKYVLTIVLSLIAVLPGAATAAIKSEIITYKQGEVVLEGILVYDDAQKGRAPGVLVIHEWTGINDNIKNKAELLASMGYVAFAADIYGKGVRPTTPDAAGAEASKYKSNRKLLRARAQAGLEVLGKSTRVDAQKLAAVGYCFGGTAVLELARSGAPVRGVVSVHGGLSSPSPDDAKNIKGRVLALHGGDDPHVPQAEVEGFEKEMRDAGVDWQLGIFGGAVHGFSNPGAGTDRSKGVAYDARADRRAVQSMKSFLTELFNG